MRFDMPELEVVVSMSPQYFVQGLVKFITTCVNLESLDLSGAWYDAEQTLLYLTITCCTTSTRLVRYKGFVV
jgi:hypothetical protein